MDYPEYWKFYSTAEQMKVIAKSLGLNRYESKSGEPYPSLPDKTFPQWWKPTELKKSVYYNSPGSWYTVQRDSETGITYVHKPL